jgi:CBS domain containing-hemolysin-like protein
VSSWNALPLIVVLLLANAFFVGAEFSLISSRRDRLEAMLAEGTARARIVVSASQQVSLLLAGAQLGITICSLLLLLVGEPAVAALLEQGLGAVGLVLPGYVLHPVAFTVALTIMTLLHVLAGEMVPKNLAIADPERVALWLVPPLVLWAKVTRPFTWLLNAAANLLLRLVKVQPKDELETAYTSHELANLLSESRREGLLEQSEHRRLSQALSSVDKTVADVLVPMAELTTLPAGVTLGAVERAVSSTGFSRFPVLAESGEVVGYIHVKDVLDQLGDAPETPVPEHKVRRLARLQRDTSLERALSTMRAEGSHLAVVEQDGRAVGVVALEDVVEEYVGTVRDGTHVTSRQRAHNTSPETDKTVT